MLEATWTSCWQDLSTEAVLLLKMMSQKIPYVNLWVTACTYYFGPSFFLEPTTHARAHTYTHTQRLILLKRFVLKHSSVWRTHNPRIITPTHTDTNAHISQQNIYHPVKTLTLLMTYRCSACYGLTIIHLYSENNIIIYNIDLQTNMFWQWCAFIRVTPSSWFAPLKAVNVSVCPVFSFS